jgi:hypothetical protein
VILCSKDQVGIILLLFTLSLQYGREGQALISKFWSQTAAKWYVGSTYLMFTDHRHWLQSDDM